LASLSKTKPCLFSSVTSLCIGAATSLTGPWWRAAGSAEADVEIDSAAVGQQHVADDALCVLVRPAVAELNQAEQNVLQLLTLCRGQRVLVDVGQQTSV